MSEFQAELKNDRRLWIGNLDPRITEFQLLKLVQIYGKIEKFDLIFHRSGPLVGLPRGYAFVTYTKTEDAVRAKYSLHDKLIGQKKIAVTWAHSAELDSTSKTKEAQDLSIPVLALNIDNKKSDRTSQIQAIEAKLKLMEHRGDELKINDSIATKPPVIQQFQFNKDKCNIDLKSKHSIKVVDRHKKPYSKRKLKQY